MNCKYIVVHCSDSPNNLDSSRHDTAGNIHEWHKENGWDGVGYHYVIDKFGSVETGRPVFKNTKTFWVGSHVRGHNSESIGICMIGVDNFNYDQMVSLGAVVQNLLEIWPEAEVVGHKDLDSSKTCPNFDVKELFKTLLENKNHD